MNSALEEMHHIPVHIQIGRARAGVIMLILSDALSIVALLAAGGYLSTLNTFGQFRAGDHGPTLLPGILAAVTLILSGLFYYLWERRARTTAWTGQNVFYLLAWLFMLATLGLQIWLGISLGYAPPFHAYASLVLLLTWYSAFHLVLAAVIGLLMLGRILRGRIAEHSYIAEVVGYWWYYTIIAGLLMWLFSIIL